MATGCRRFRIGDTAPARARRLGHVNVHPVALARSEAQITLPGERLQERAPARSQGIADVAESGPGHDRRDELLAGQDGAASTSRTATRNASISFGLTPK